MAQIKNIFFRVDANKKIGSGHLVRCEIIADNIKRKKIPCNIFFVVKTIAESFKNRLESKGYKVIRLTNLSDNDLQEQKELLKQYQNTVLIVDSDEPLYYTKKYQLGIKNIIDHLIMITFYNEPHFYADVIHNQNIRAPELNYSCESYTQKLLGTQYVVLKGRYKELAGKQRKQVYDDRKKTVMLTFGGADIPDRTNLTYAALQYLKDSISKIIIVLGAMYEHRDKLETSIKKSDIDTKLYQDTDKMPDLMAQCDIALTSGGLTSWELGALGVLNIIFPHSKRERLSASFMDHDKYAYTVKGVQNKSKEKIAEIIENILEDDYLKRVTKLRNAINLNGVDDLIKSIIYQGDY